MFQTTNQLYIYIYIYVTGFFIIFMNQLFNDGWFICPNMDSVNELNVCKAFGRPTSLKLAWICLRSPKPTSCYRGNITAIRHSNQLSSCIFHRRNKHNAPTHTKHDKTLSDYMITLNPISVFNWLSEGLTIPGPMKKTSMWMCYHQTYPGFQVGPLNRVNTQGEATIPLAKPFPAYGWNPRKADDWSSLINKKLGAFFNEWNTSLSPDWFKGKCEQEAMPILGVPVAGNVSRVTGLAFCTRSWRAFFRIFFAASSSLCN